MSVQRHRDAWKVRWRENGQHRSRSFARKGDADLFDAEIKRRLALGPHLTRELARSVTTLDDFVNGGFRGHAATLSAATRRHYRWALENHLVELQDEPLIALDVPRLVTHQQHLLASGRSANTVRAAMTRLSGILQAATEQGLIAANPVRGMRKVPADPKEDVKPLAPGDLEKVIAGLDGRSRAIALLCGHLGLRPLEARTVRWSDFDGAGLTISRARTKRSAARTRVIAVPTITARELRAWQMESGGRGDDPIIGLLGEDGLRLWAYKHLDVAARRATGRDDVTLYTLRHSHASALHYCGWTVPDAAERMGHSAVVHMGIYAHPIKVIGSQRYRDLDDLIAEARAELVCPQSAPGTAKPQ
jgi:integrase